MNTKPKIRTKDVHVKLSESELGAIQKHAKVENRSISNMVQVLLLEALKTHRTKKG